MPPKKIDRLTEEKLRCLQEYLALPHPVLVVRTREVEKSDEVVIEYRMQLENGGVVDLGSAKDLLSFSKVRAAFAEYIGHVVPTKARSGWDEIVQWLIDVEKEMRGVKVTGEKGS